MRHAASCVRWVLIAWLVASAGTAGLGCKGSGSADAGFCGLTDLFHGACGGSVSGSGTTPLGTPFDPSAVHVAVGSTCSSAATDHSVQYIEIAYGPDHDFARITFADRADGGVGTFLGSHPVRATFTSFSTCTRSPDATIVEITSVPAEGNVELTAGDDPNAIWSAQVGTVTGTFTFSSFGLSGSGSFASPYCKFYECP